MYKATKETKYENPNISADVNAPTTIKHEAEKQHNTN